jgi:hypothetical protein
LVKRGLELEPGLSIRNRPSAVTLSPVMRKTTTWTAQHEADLIWLAKLGYSAARLHVLFKRPIAFLIARAKRLGVVINKPTRLPYRERSAITAVAQMWPKSTN